MKRTTGSRQLGCGPRVRLRRISRSCLFREPHRRPAPGPARGPAELRSHCRYTLQTSPPLFRQRKR